MPPKGDKKDAKPEGWDLSPIEFGFVLLFILALVGSIGPTISNFVRNGEVTFYGYRVGAIVEFFKAHIQFFKALGYAIAGAGAIGTFIYVKKADAIWRDEKAKVYPVNFDPSAPVPEVESGPTALQEKWAQIVANSESMEPSLWRLAIIEADIMLDDLLQTLNLPGETMGEKLKAVEKSDFTTIDAAWEGHKVRNMIAHEGSRFQLNQREAREVITLYEKVFKEFYLI